MIIITISRLHFHSRLVELPRKLDWARGCFHRSRLGRSKGPFNVQCLIFRTAFFATVAGGSFLPEAFPVSRRPRGLYRVTATAAETLQELRNAPDGEEDRIGE